MHGDAGDSTGEGDGRPVKPEIVPKTADARDGGRRRRRGRLTLEQWQRWTDWPLTFLAIWFLAAYSWQVLRRPENRMPTETVMNVIWAVFVADYVVSLILVKDRATWFVHHLFDLASVVLPLVRPLRLLRLFTVLKVLQRKTGMALRCRITIYVIGAVVLMIYVGALAILDVEYADPDRQITSFGEAIWWAFVTITTVGYGDYAPVTVQGRLIAMALMLGGIALISAVTATVASWIMEQVSGDSQKVWSKRLQNDIKREMDADSREGAARDADLMARLDMLNSRLERMERLYGWSSGRPRNPDDITSPRRIRAGSDARGSGTSSPRPQEGDTRRDADGRVDGV